MSVKSLSDKVDFFFAKPNFNDGNPVYSPLFLLRKHVRISFGIDPNQPAALWPGSMAILAGIDMLSIYYNGNIEVISENGIDINIFRSNRSSFINFCETFFDLSHDDSEAIYMFRNALMHTFGLVATNISNNSPNFHKQYWFSASDDQNSKCILTLLSEDDHNKQYEIFLYKLQQQFEVAVDKYRACINSDPQIAKFFEDIFDLIGTYSYGPIQQ